MLARFRLFGVTIQWPNDNVCKAQHVATSASHFISWWHHILWFVLPQHLSLLEALPCCVRSKVGFRQLQDVLLPERLENWFWGASTWYFLIFVQLSPRYFERMDITTDIGMFSYHFVELHNFGSTLCGFFCINNIRYKRWCKSLFLMWALVCGLHT